MLNFHKSNFLLFKLTEFISNPTVCQRERLVHIKLGCCMFLQGKKENFKNGWNDGTKVKDKHSHTRSHEVRHTCVEQSHSSPLE